MTRGGGYYYIVGYGGKIDLPTIDMITSEKTIVGNLVGTYPELVELMALADRGLVNLATRRIPAGARPIKRCTTCITAKSRVARSWCRDRAPSATVAIGAVSAIPLAAARPLLDHARRTLARAGAGAGGRVGRRRVAPRLLAMGDGSVVIVPAAWNGAPRVRPRDGGGIELVPGSSDATGRRSSGRAQHARACSITADPDGGFLAGSADGRIGARAGRPARSTPWSSTARAPCTARRRARRMAGDGGRQCGAAARAWLHRHRRCRAGRLPRCLDPAGARLADRHIAMASRCGPAATRRARMPAPGDHLALAWSSRQRLACRSRRETARCTCGRCRMQSKCASRQIGAVAALAALGVIGW